MSGAGARRRRARLAWVIVALGLAAVVAAGVARSGPAPSAPARAAALDAELRCPSCDGISVADSSASTAAAVRRVVAARVRAGQSDAQIEAYLVSRYGPSILLRPPLSGISALVWIVPLVAGAGAVVGLTLFFWRRRRPPPVAVTEEDRALVDRALTQAPAPRRSAGVSP